MLARLLVRGMRAGTLSAADAAARQHLGGNRAGAGAGARAGLDADDLGAAALMVNLWILNKLRESEMNKPCPCGSGFRRRELVDAKGYFCTFYCDKCEKEKRAKFRPEIFTDSNYYTEPGEDDPQ
jgi:hypothetical protein